MFTDIIIGIGDLSATALNQSAMPSCLTTVAKKPGVRQRPQPQPASFASLSCWTTSPIFWLEVPAMRG